MLDRHVPVNQRYIGANQDPFMNKTLQKTEIARFSKKKNLKHKTQSNESAYKKHRNYCVNLFRNGKKNLHENLEIKNITDNKNFWKTMKFFLANINSNSRNKITI